MPIRPDSPGTPSLPRNWSVQIPRSSTRRLPRCRRLRLKLHLPQRDFGPTTPSAQELQPNVRVARNPGGAEQLLPFSIDRRLLSQVTACCRLMGISGGREGTIAKPLEPQYYWLECQPVNLVCLHQESTPHATQDGDGLVCAHSASSWPTASHSVGMFSSVKIDSAAVSFAVPSSFCCRSNEPHCR